MRTAEEMADFFVNLASEIDKKPCTSTDRDRFVKEFKVIENSLMDDEDVLYVIRALNIFGRNGQPLTPGISFCAVAFTADRCVFGQKAKFSGDSFHAVLYDNFSDIRVQKKLFGFPRIILDFLTEEVSLEVAPAAVDRYFKDIREIIENYRKSKKEAQNTTVVMQTSAADELKKFKELLDMGVITQEEFDAKKKQLLGL